jgi:hypothetical protein
MGAPVKNNKQSPQEQIFSIVLGFWQARALAVATELGLPNLLAEGPLHVDEVASRTKTNASALFRLLRALESTGIHLGNRILSAISATGISGSLSEIPAPRL